MSVGRCRCEAHLHVCLYPYAHHVRREDVSRVWYRQSFVSPDTSPSRARTGGGMASRSTKSAACACQWAACLPSHPRRAALVFCIRLKEDIGYTATRVQFEGRCIQYRVRKPSPNGYAHQSFSSPDAGDRPASYSPSVRPHRRFRPAQAVHPCPASRLPTR
jgi:hypothetical protein